MNKQFLGLLISSTASLIAMETIVVSSSDANDSTGTAATSAPIVLQQAQTEFEFIAKAQALNAVDLTELQEKRGKQLYDVKQAELDELLKKFDPQKTAFDQRKAEYEQKVAAAEAKKAEDLSKIEEEKNAAIAENTRKRDEAFQKKVAAVIALDEEKEGKVAAAKEIAAKPSWSGAVTKIFKGETDFDKKFNEEYDPQYKALEDAYAKETEGLLTEVGVGASYAPRIVAVEDACEEELNKLALEYGDIAEETMPWAAEEKVLKEAYQPFLDEEKALVKLLDDKLKLSASTPEETNRELLDELIVWGIKK